MTNKKSPLLSPDQLKRVALEFPSFLQDPSTYKAKGLSIAKGILELNMDKAGLGGIDGYTSLSEATRQVAGIVLNKTKLKKQVPANLRKLADLALGSLGL